MATPLVVNAVELLRWPGTTKDVVVAIAVEDFEFRDDRVVDEDIEVTLHLESMSNGISVRGVAVSTWSGLCCRCAQPITTREATEMTELFQRTVEDPDAYAIENDQLNLLPMVRENILLAIPLAPFCRPDCPGLCPHCGIDLSHDTCSCQVETSDPRWAALESLRGNLDDPAV